MWTSLSGIFNDWSFLHITLPLQPLPDEDWGKQEASVGNPGVLNNILVSSGFATPAADTRRVRFGIGRPRELDRRRDDIPTAPMAARGQR